MQKIITVTIDLDRLQSADQQENPNAFHFVNELPEVNQLLEEGWRIEEWENLSQQGGAKACLLFILSDESDDLLDEYEFEAEHGTTEE